MCSWSLSILAVILVVPLSIWLAITALGLLLKALITLTVPINAVFHVAHTLAASLVTTGPIGGKFWIIFGVIWAIVCLESIRLTTCTAVTAYASGKWDTFCNIPFQLF